MEFGVINPRVCTCLNSCPSIDINKVPFSPNSMNILHHSLAIVHLPTIAPRVEQHLVPVCNTVMCHCVTPRLLRFVFRLSLLPVSLLLYRVQWVMKMVGAEYTIWMGCSMYTQFVFWSISCYFNSRCAKHAVGFELDYSTSWSLFYYVNRFFCSCQLV